MVSMKDVSRHAGVSVATVSNVITGKRTVSEKMRKRVLRSIDELNYQVNLVARGLKTQKTSTIGVILPDITKLFFQNVLKGILDTAYANGYHINILNSAYDFSAEADLVKTLKGICVDGIILDSCVAYENSHAWAEELVAGNNATPVVSMESRLDSAQISSVTVDNAFYSAAITQHLIDSGRRRIFYVSGPLHLEHEYARYQGFVHCLEKNGLSLDAELTGIGTYLSESGYVAVRRALESGASLDAVQASNDQAAIGALKALKEYKLRVPEDVAVCGFDNLFPSTLVSPAITTVDVPSYEIGEAAVKEVLRRIENPNLEPRSQILKARIVIRESSRKGAPSQWDLSNW